MAITQEREADELYKEVGTLGGQNKLFAIAKYGQRFKDFIHIWQVKVIEETFLRKKVDIRQRYHRKEAAE